MEENVLGIIAGAGDLPHAVAESARGAGRPVFLLSVTNDENETRADRISNASVSIGELAKAIKLLKNAGCIEIVLAGRVNRPKFSELKLDARGIMALPGLLSAAKKGDDALLRATVSLFEREGFRIIGVQDAAPDLIVREGIMSRVKPAQTHREDIEQGFRIAHALGSFDIGQAAVICEGLVLAVEAAEGTDAMLMRVADLPGQLRGTPDEKRGVLIKALKPVQDRKTDLPVIGVKTVELVHAAGLAGIAVEAGAALIVSRKEVIASADRLGVFVAGMACHV